MQFYSGYGNRAMVDYVNTMEPEAYGHDIPHEQHSVEMHDDMPEMVSAPAMASGNDEDASSGSNPLGNLSIKDIGMSVPMGIAANNVAGIYSKIRMGAGAIEIQFAGAGKSQRGAYTPEIFGEEQRQAIREMAAINEIKLTTHASFGVMGISGYAGDSPFNPYFQREQRKQSLDEVKRAIEFARDTAGGGSVVVHTGEVDRPISEQPWARDKYGRYIFKAFEEEDKAAKYRTVDDRTGMVRLIKKNERVWRPEWLRSDKDYDGEDTHGNKVKIRGRKIDSNGKVISDGDYIDYLGKKIAQEDWYSHEYGRVPVFEEKERRFKTRLYSWDEMSKEAEERNRWKAQMLKKSVGDLTPDERTTSEEVYARSALEVEEGHNRGWSLQFSISVNRHIENIVKIKKALGFYELLEKDIPDEEKWRIKRQIHTMGGEVGQLVPPDSKNPTEMLKQSLEEEEKMLIYARQSGTSMLVRAQDQYEGQLHTVSADKYAIREATKSYADAGIYAMQNTINKKNPVYVSLEHIFPERFGGHLTELKQLVEDSREEMVARLSHKKIRDPAGTIISYQEALDMGNIALAGKIKDIDNPYYRGIPESDARKLAETHIKATLDTGHINMWRKYWQEEPNKSREQNDSEFKKWVLNEVESMAKHKMFGNVHLVDNLGYQDEHLSPGQGNAPIKEMIAVLRKHGYDKNYTVEPGADASVDNSDFHGLMKTWRFFDSPVYGFGIRTGGQSQSWSDVHYSYFGQDKPPYFVFGSYSPSNEWTLWSGMPME